MFTVLAVLPCLACLAPAAAKLLSLPRMRVSAEQPVTVGAIAASAGVSRSWLYA